MSSTPRRYEDAGVSISDGDTASEIMFEASRLTWDNRLGLPGYVSCADGWFSALRSVAVSGFSEGLLGLNFDGVGTKIEIAERMNDFRTIAYDLFAMICDDAAIRGAEPILVGTILDFNRLNLGVVRQLAEGMVNAAKDSRVSVINGEVAELGERVGGYGDFCFNWGGAALWIGRRERMITGKGVLPGQAVVGLRETGIRSNGVSLLRGVFNGCYGSSWHEHEFGGQSLGRAVLQPSRIYTSAIVEMTGGYCSPPSTPVTGFAHITGGGIPGKLGRLLRASGYGAILDDLFDPPDVLAACADLGGIDTSEAYRTWNMGQGLLVVTPSPEEVIAIAAKNGVESRTVGTIQREPTINVHGWAGAGRKRWLGFPVPSGSSSPRD